ncbi:expressed unknown protein [Seminavis robusta]|uniref:Uncharacterized protein n=1 Tax=Seminavis robusta TaxID=568900 RepID=A0A9N8ELZ8_9STRA|nr:expressed unknown protein [Seminavis robusta]|eukprot:Sro1189_g250700.1 n/a (330) ;mRNA; r:21244-22329
MRLQYVLLLEILLLTPPTALASFTHFYHRLQSHQEVILPATTCRGAFLPTATTPCTVLSAFPNLFANGEDPHAQKLRELSSRLQGLQEDQAAKEDGYQARIRTIVEEMGQREKDLLEKIQYFANQLQQYRFDAQKTLLAAKEASSNKERKLDQEIRTYQFKLASLQEDYRKAQSLAGRLKGERRDLERDLRKLRQTYQRELSYWETRYEREQDKLVKEQEKNRVLQSQAQESAKQRELERLQDYRNAERKIQTVYETHLGQMEKLLGDVAVEAQNSVVYMQELEAERYSLRQLTVQSYKLLSTRFLASAAKVLRKKSSTKAKEEEGALI